MSHKWMITCDYYHYNDNFRYESYIPSGMCNVDGFMYIVKIRIDSTTYHSTRIPFRTTCNMPPMYMKQLTQ